MISSYTGLCPSCGCEAFAVTGSTGSDHFSATCMAGHRWSVSIETHPKVQTPAMRLGDHLCVDLDGVLAYDDGYQGPEHIGAPIPAMLARVKAWRNDGIPVHIFTARVSRDGDHERKLLAHRERLAIERWCLTHLGEVLPITCEKSWRCAALFDDKAFRVEHNTGRILNEAPQEVA